MFAPAHHQATRFVVPVRRELAVRTIFNLLGPLTNPAGARRQLIGVSDPAFLETIAGALARLGVDRALVVSSVDGLDEISIVAPTTVIEVNGEELTRYTLTARRRRRADRPVSFERRRCWRGQPAGERADDARDPLDGEAGGLRASTDLAAINAGAAIYVAGRRFDRRRRAGRRAEALAGGRAADALERVSRASRPPRARAGDPR